MTSTAQEDLIDDAHRVATRQDPSDLAGRLQDVLSQKLVAYAVGDKHPKTIGRYARRERVPADEVLGRLVDLYMVVEILSRGMQERTIKSWMLGTNMRLKGKSPLAVMHEGKSADVIGAAKAFITGR